MTRCNICNIAQPKGARSLCLIRSAIVSIELPVPDPLYWRFFRIRGCGRAGLRPGSPWGYLFRIEYAGPTLSTDVRAQLCSFATVRVSDRNVVGVDGSHR